MKKNLKLLKNISGQKNLETIIDRNSHFRLKNSNDAFFKKIFEFKKNIDSCLEVGANIGLNLISLKKILKIKSNLLSR